MTIHNKQKTISLLSLMLLSSIVSTQATSNSEEVTSTGQEERSNREMQTVTGVTKSDKSIFIAKKIIYYILSFVVTLIVGFLIVAVVCWIIYYYNKKDNYDLNKKDQTEKINNESFKPFGGGSYQHFTIVVLLFLFSTQLANLFNFLTSKLLNYSSPLDEQKQESL